MQNISAKVMTRHNFLITKAPSMKFITLLLLLRHVLYCGLQLESERHILTTFQAQRRHDLAQKNWSCFVPPSQEIPGFMKLRLSFYRNRVRDTPESHLCSTKLPQQTSNFQKMILSANQHIDELLTFSHLRL